MSSKEAVDLLQSDLTLGLKSRDVEQRLKQFGYNEVSETKTNPLLDFAKKFWGVTAWMLEIIIVLSYFLQRYFDLYIVTGLLLFNSVLGFAEEWKASNTVEALKEKLHVNARVLRDSQWRLVPSRELVPGDVVRIRSGDFVPADVKIIDGRLEVDQSALTGESLNVEKKSDELLYSGSTVRRGESNGIVLSTGVKTYFGRTVQLVQLAKPRLHIERVVSRVVRWLLGIVIILILLATVFSVLDAKDLLQLLPIILVLLLSAIPVALPAMFTVSMAVGSMELAKKNVLVTRLSASEDAATMNVLCVDKTGTITVNRLSLSQVTPMNTFTENDVILYGALASEQANQDPIDLAFISAASQRALAVSEFVTNRFVPFDPTIRRTEAEVQRGSESFKVMKGAVDTIVKASTLGSGKKGELEAKMNELASRGYRTIAVARADGKGRTELVGLAALYDPARPDSKELVRELRDLGISVKMLTGDALPIAKEIAADVGLGSNVIRASDLKELIKDNPLIAVQEAEKSGGFAEVYPEDKYTIVKSLQASKHVVGMTGDGVNDAPALRQAEVGIAVSNATDVAKSAASVVLTSEGLTSIVALVENGRVIYERITAWILSKIVRTLQIATFTVLSFLLTGNYIVSAFAVILYFFMTDFVKIALSTDNQRWSKKPDNWNITGLVKISIVLGALVIIESLGLVYIAFAYFGLTAESAGIYTLTFEILFYSAIFLIFNVRERGHFWDSRPSTTLLVAMISSLAVGFILSTTGIGDLAPLPLVQNFLILIYSLVLSLILNDLVKYYLTNRTSMKW